jgi:copper chaperone CopZ
VESAVADLEKKNVTVVGIFDVEAVKKAISAEDYEILEEAKANTVVIGVGGMMCSHCTAAVEKACLSVPGVESAVADLEKKNVTVIGNADVEAIKKAIIAEEYEILEG